MTARSGTRPPFVAPGPVFLIGFMGSGKTTLGRALAARFAGTRYVDLDEEVEREAGMSVREIFATFGEAGFRRLESEALRRLASEAGMVVGCGGGTPCQPGNMDLMNRGGLTVVLRASDEALHRRLTEAQGSRPLLDGMDSGELRRFIRAEQERREPFYGQARLEFPSDLLESEEEIAASCEAFASLVAGYYKGLDAPEKTNSQS